MAKSDRVRWTLAGLALLAVVGAILVARWSRHGTHPIVSEQERETVSDAQGPVLEGRADTGLAPGGATGEVSDGRTASFRVLAPDGRAAAGASISYRALDRMADWSKGVAGADGLVNLVPPVVGERCQIKVGAGASWAAHTFDVWAEGEVTLRLPAGCAVWFDLPAMDAAGIGQMLRFGAEGADLSKTITESRTFLGRFEGDFHLYALGTKPAAASLNAILLPPSGEVTVLWEAKRTERPNPLWLRVRGPEDSNATPAVTLSETEDFIDATEVAPRRFEPGAVVLGVAAGSVTILATSGGSWAFGGVMADPHDEPVDVPLTWTKGCALEVRLPAEPTGEVELHVQRMPGRTHAFSGWSETVDRTPGLLVFPEEVRTFPAGKWPEASRRPNATTRVWEGLPRGADVHVVVPTERWGTLQADVRIPREGERAVLEVPAGARFTVRAVAKGGPDPDVWLDLSCSDEFETILGRTRTRDGAVVVTGIPPGKEIWISMRESDWTGEAKATVVDGGEVRVPLMRRPTAHFRVRVVDQVGRPLAHVGVSFGAHDDVGTTVLTDADGWAEGVIASDRAVRASAAHPGLTSDLVPVPAGGEATVVVQRSRAVHVVFELSEQEVEIDESWRGGELRGGNSRRWRVFPGSRYELGVPPGTTHVGVRVLSVTPDGQRELFDQEVEIEREGPTTLRVTR